MNSQSTLSIKKTLYQSFNQEVFDRVPADVKMILDIGCGTGLLGQALQQRYNCSVYGITYSEEEANQASQNLFSVVTADLNDIDFSALPFDLGEFDCIICSHILEHLYYPDIFLDNLRRRMSDSAVLVIALPNVLNWRQHLTFLKGEFRYADSGVLDRTHFRFFDWRTTRELAVKSGYAVLDYCAEGYVPLPVVRKLLPGLSRYIDKLATRKFPGLFGTQFILTVKP